MTQMTDTPEAKPLTEVTATFYLNEQHCEAVPVINPNGWFGKCHIVQICDSHEPFYLVLEADNLQDALDALAEDPTYNHHVMIDEAAYGDYGWPVAAGETMWGEVVAEPCYIDLNGKRRSERLTPPQVSGDGVYYDTDNVHFYEGHAGMRLRYYGVYEGEALPSVGLQPKKFEDWLDWQKGEEEFWSEPS